MNFGMGDLPESFSVSVRVRTKHTENTRVGLWGQSAMLKAVWDVTVYLSDQTPIPKLKTFS